MRHMWEVCNLGGDRNIIIYLFFTCLMQWLQLECAREGSPWAIKHDSVLIKHKSRKSRWVEVNPRWLICSLRLHFWVYLEAFSPWFSATSCSVIIFLPLWASGKQLTFFSSSPVFLFFSFVFSMLLQPLLWWKSLCCLHSFFSPQCDSLVLKPFFPRRAQVKPATPTRILSLGKFLVWRVNLVFVWEEG